MSRYYSKRNKNKVWRNTYGKPFILRRAFKYAQMAMITAQSVARINIISSASPCAGITLKAAAVAEAAIAMGEAINSIGFNEGFAPK